MITFAVILSTLAFVMAAGAYLIVAVATVDKEEFETRDQIDARWKALEEANRDLLYLQLTR